MTSSDKPGDEDDEWRFAVSEVGDEESGGNVAGSFGPGDVEAGDINPEHALFVLLGVLAAGFVVLGFVFTLL